MLMNKRSCPSIGKEKKMPSLAESHLTSFHQPFSVVRLFCVSEVIFKNDLLEDKTIIGLSYLNL